jgi:ATP-dependent RNA helicase RhlB
MTDVQEQTLSRTLEGVDAAVQSQTGTGKTAAFLVTLFERMSRPGGTPRKKALIIVPTRELAVQIEGEARLLGRHLGFRIGCFYGGVGYAGQLAALKRGVEIIIGTPGRLLDLSERGILRLNEIGFLVIDEADRLFDMGFLPDIKRLLKGMVPRTARQSMLFSATLSRVSRTIAAEYLNRPAFIELEPEHLTVDTITQKLYHVKSHIKTNLLLGVLRDQHPRNALIFTNMRRTAERLVHGLEANGIAAAAITGDVEQRRRLKLLTDFKEGRLPVLVATDVASRGLHIEGVTHVINYDLPQDPDDYVHRAGRTARAGASSKAISLACEAYVEALLEDHLPVPPEVELQEVELEVA